MAVDFFFVLSGFIMSYTYFPVFQADGINAFIPFFLKRVARIFPLGLAMLAVILLLGSVASIWGRSDIFIDENVVHAGLAQYGSVKRLSELPDGPPQAVCATPPGT